MFYSSLYIRDGNIIINTGLTFLSLMVVMVVMVREWVSVLLSSDLILSSHITCSLSGSLSLTGRERERERERERAPPSDLWPEKRKLCGVSQPVTPRALQSLQQAEHAGHLLYALHVDIGHWFHSSHHWYRNYAGVTPPADILITALLLLYYRYRL